MAITYYPDSLIKKFTSPAEQAQKRTQLLSVSGHGDLTSGFAYVFAPGADCAIQEVQLAFGSNASKSYAVSKAIGRSVITGVNDQLWIKVDGAPAQSIIIAPGFYNGTNLATVIQSALNANSVFVNAGVTPFAVTYTASTGIFAIATNAGTAGYYNLNTTMAAFHGRSTAGPLIGFNADKANSGTISSDTPVYGLNVVNDLISATGSSDQHVVSTDVWALDIDQGLQISTGNVATTIDYKIVYQLL